MVNESSERIGRIFKGEEHLDQIKEVVHEVQRISKNDPLVALGILHVALEELKEAFGGGIISLGGEVAKS